jgi:5-methylcytosine-specific restriction protein A
MTETGVPVEGGSQQNPDWTWDEQVLAFDLYLRHGAIGDEHPLVHELSQLLQDLPIHPPETRMATFRNPNGVARKLGDIHTHQPSYTGKPTSGSRLDTEVWERYGHDRVRLERVAATIRSGARLANQREDDEVEVESAHQEGRIIYRLHRGRERDPKLRRRKIAAVRKLTGRLACEACDSELEQTYGAVGAAVFECHHLVPLYETGETVTSVRDVALLCPNCHRVAHRIDPWPTLSDLSHLVRRTAEADS